MITKDAFAESLQAQMNEHGYKTSKEKSWKLFKAFVKVIVDGVVEDPDNKISLAGIGNFEMLKAAARSSKKGLVDFVPRLRWRTSSKVDAYLEEATGQVPDPEKREALKAKMRKDGTLTSNLPPRGDATAAPAAAKPAAEKPAEAAPAAAADDGFDDDNF